MAVTGSYFHSKTRFREFALRFELDKNRQALEESNQKLMELDQIKSRFFANISHELRTPLTLLLAPLESLLRRFNLEPDTKDLLVTMHSNGMRLLKLINDLLDLVRLESGRMEVKHEPLEVAEFVKGLASAARQVADDKRLRLETVVDPALGTVLGDRDKLEKIVLNLVFNALKFTPAGGRVELRAEKRGERFRPDRRGHGHGHLGEEPAARVRPLLAGGRVFEAQVPGSWHRAGAGERTGGDPGWQSYRPKPGRQRHHLYGDAAVSKSRAGAQAQVPKRRLQTAPDAAADGGTVTSEEWLANLYRRAELFPALTPLQESLRPVETARNGSLPTILVADDEPDMLRFLKSQLSTHYRVLEAVDGQQAIEEGQPVFAGHHPAGHDDAGEGRVAGLPGNPRAHAHAEHSHRPAHGARR